MLMSLRRRYSPQTWLTIVSLGLLLCVFLSYALRSTGVYYDDDLLHVQIARYSWQHPELWFNVWGRPTFTLLYAPVSVFGLTAARLFSVCLAAAVCAGAAYLAWLYGVRWFWLAAFLTGLQPEFLRLAFSTLTELPFALFFCLALIMYKRERLGWMAFAAGWLPLARYESLPLLLVFAFVLMYRRQMRYLPLLAAPLLVQNSFHAVQQQSLSLLLFPLDQILGIRSGVAAFDYGRGDPFYYLVQAPVAFGGACFALACYGMLRTRFGMLHASVLITIAVLCISYWRLTSAGVAGYLRHLAIVAPAVGVLAALGLERMFDPLRSQRMRWIVVALAAVLAGWMALRRIWTASLTAVIAMLLTLLHLRQEQIQRLIIGALLVVAIAPSLMRVQPFVLNEEQGLAIQAGRWLTTAPYNDRLVLGSHVWFEYGRQLDPFDTAQYRAITPSNVESAPAGTIVVWDSHYSHRLIWQTPLAALQDSARFRLLKTWKGAHFELFIYEKLVD